MEFRQGTCTSCKNSFRVPATFTAAKAKCPKCGGVVEIGPVQGSAPSGAAPEAPKPVPASVPAPKPAAAIPSAPPPVPKAAAPKAPLPPTPKPAPAPAASSKPAAAKSESTPKPASAPKAASTPKSAAAPARPAAKESVRSAAASAAKRVKDKDKDNAETGSRRARGGPQKKSLAPMLGALAFLIVMGGTAYWYFVYKLPQEHTQAKELANAEATGSGDASANSAAPSGAPASEVPGNSAGTTPETLTTESPEAAAAKAEPEKPAEETPKAASTTPETVEDIDLTAIPDLERLPGTSDEDWQKYNELVKNMTDPNSGAKGSRAANQLIEIGKPAFPAILNGFKRLDLTSDDGFRMADVTQKTLERLCNGNNFGWKYPSQEPDKYLLFDKKAIKAWIGAWERAKDDEAFWLKLTKQDKKEAEEGAAEGGEAKAGALDDF